MVYFIKNYGFEKVDFGRQCFFAPSLANSLIFRSLIGQITHFPTSSEGVSDPFRSCFEYFPKAFLMFSEPVSIILRRRFEYFPKAFPTTSEKNFGNIRKCFEYFPIMFLVFFESVSSSFQKIFDVSKIIQRFIQHFKFKLP